MRCETCGAEARGRILFEMWHGLDAPGFGGFCVAVGPWCCGTHKLPSPGAEEARYFAQRFHVVHARPPQEIRVGSGFVEMNETDGRWLEREPEGLHKRQVNGSVTIESATPEEWRRLQKQVEARDALMSRVRAGASR